MPANRLMAVDVGATHVSMGVFSRGCGQRLTLHEFATERLAALPADEAGWLVEVQRGLGDVAARIGCRGACVLVIPEHVVWQKRVAIEEVPGEDRWRAISRFAAENIPTPVADVIWNHADIAGSNEIMLVAARRDPVEWVCDAVQAVGLEVTEVVSASAALVGGCRQGYADLTGCGALVSVGARSSQLLWIDDANYHVRSLRVTGNTVTEAIAQELRIDFGAAEKLKSDMARGDSALAPGSSARQAAERALADFAAKLAREVLRSRIDLQRKTGGRVPNHVRVAGGATRFAGLMDALSAALGVPVCRHETLRHVDVAARANDAGFGDGEAGLAEVTGAAATWLCDQPAGVSLLPLRRRQAKTFRSRQPSLLAAAVCGALAFVPPAYYLEARAAAIRADLDRVDQQLIPLRRQQAVNSARRGVLDQIEREIHALEAAAAGKTRWPGLLSELQDKLAAAGDAWFDRLVVERPVSGLDRTDPALRLQVSGRLLDVENPSAKVSADSMHRVQQLLASLPDSRLVAAIEDERFDPGEKGILRFDFTLVLRERGAR